MVSNRRGPTNNCGCCAPPCTCLIAKESFRGIAVTLAVDGPPFSIPDRCDVSNSLDGEFSASTAINYDDGFCGESVGSSICPDAQSFYFGPFSITGVIGATSTVATTWLAGRTGNCLVSTNECDITESGIDAPGICTGYGRIAYYDPIAQAGAGIAYICRGGNLGTPAYSLYVSASYKIYDWGSAFIGVPAAPTGWTRTSSGGGGSVVNYLYTRNDGLATLTLTRTFSWYSSRFCDGIFIESSSAVPLWQLAAFTVASTDNATSVTLDYPFDPAGLFASVVGTVT